MPVLPRLAFEEAREVIVPRVERLPHQGERRTRHVCFHEPFLCVTQERFYDPRRDAEILLHTIAHGAADVMQERTLEEARESLKEAVQLIVGANRELARREAEGHQVVREPLAVPVE